MWFYLIICGFILLYVVLFTLCGFVQARLWGQARGFRQTQHNIHVLYGSATGAFS